MSGTTRPIPISHGRHSQRGSPIGAIDAGAGEVDADGVAANGMISQSCPVNGHGAAAYYRPPRAPVIGSLPEPSFMLGGGGLDEMPELVLPPPAQQEGVVGSAPGRREASVVQVASSCPVDIGFFRPGPPSQQNSWTPSPRASDEFDLSKSPALAVMSAMRQSRRPSFDQRRGVNGSSSSLSQSQERYHDNHARSFGMAGSRRISDPPYRPPASNSFVDSNSYFFGEDRMDDEIQSQEFAMENLSLDGPTPSSAESAASNDPNSTGLPPRRPERRGSYDGGIFHFEDQ